MVLWTKKAVIFAGYMFCPLLRNDKHRLRLRLRLNLFTGDKTDRRADLSSICRYLNSIISHMHVVCLYPKYNQSIQSRQLRRNKLLLAVIDTEGGKYEAKQIIKVLYSADW